MSAKVVYIYGIFILSLLTLNINDVEAQAPWEVGVKGGESFYLGDANRTLFNDFALAGGAYVRYNWNPRWTSKIQIAYGTINSPIDNDYLTGDVQMEFNFFPYGQMLSSIWSRFFTPYITAGLGLNSFDDRRGKMCYAVNIPFGIGVKCKIYNRINIGLEWTLHKMFNDKFDYLDNPYNYEQHSSVANKDWFSMATLFVGIDIGNRNRYCK